MNKQKHLRMPKFTSPITQHWRPWTVHSHSWKPKPHCGKERGGLPSHKCFPNLFLPNTSTQEKNKNRKILRFKLVMWVFFLIVKLTKAKLIYIFNLTSLSTTKMCSFRHEYFSRNHKNLVQFPKLRENVKTYRIKIITASSALFTLKKVEKQGLHI